MLRGAEERQRRVERLARGRRGGFVGARCVSANGEPPTRARQKSLGRRRDALDVDVLAVVQPTQLIAQPHAATDGPAAAARTDEERTAAPAERAEGVGEWASSDAGTKLVAVAVSVMTATARSWESADRVAAAVAIAVG